MDTSFVLNRYGGRLVTYLGVALVGSVLGSMLSWTSDVWADVNPLSVGVAAGLFSLGPAAAIVAAIRVNAVIAASIAATAAIAMVAMWWLFVSNESSTSSLAFLWGWFFGIPLAIAAMLVSHWSDNRKATTGDARR